MLSGPQAFNAFQHKLQRDIRFDLSASLYSNLKKWKTRQGSISYPLNHTSVPFLGTSPFVGKMDLLVQMNLPIAFLMDWNPVNSSFEERMIYASKYQLTPIFSIIASKKLKYMNWLDEWEKRAVDAWQKI